MKGKGASALVTPPPSTGLFTAVANYKSQMLGLIDWDLVILGLANGICHQIRNTKVFELFYESVPCMLGFSRRNNQKLRDIVLS